MNRQSLSPVCVPTALAFLMVIGFAFTACNSSESVDDDGGTPGEKGTGVDTNGDTENPDTGDGAKDSDGETDSQAPEDTDIPEMPICDDGLRPACYGEEVWCFDEENLPRERIEVCEGGEICAQITEDYAKCRCEKKYRRECFNGDIWFYDSCGNMDGIEKKCEGTSECLVVPTPGEDAELACCELEGHRQCNEQGNIEISHACEGLGPVAAEKIEECNAGPGSGCRNRSSSDAECYCKNHWSGEKCDVCPSNFDASTDCEKCSGYWTGSNCDICSGQGENCQCPDLDNVVVQPETGYCWSCPYPSVKDDDGKCWFNNEEGGIEQLLWEDARAACPEGFDLPSLDDIRVFFPECKELYGVLHCRECYFGSTCQEIFKYYKTPEYVPWEYSMWTRDEYYAGHWGIEIRNSDATQINKSEKAISICVLPN